MSYDPLLAIIEHLDADVPFTKGVEGLRLETPDRRISVGLSKRDGKYVLALLVEKEDGWARQRAQEMESSHPNRVIVEVTGKAYSSTPSSVPRGTSSELLPGFSIGHWRGYPGTLGGFVVVKAGSKTWAGIISASHVLSNNNAAAKGDRILYPGCPDGPRTLAQLIGTLADYTLLVHYQDEESDPVNTEDIAVVQPDNLASLPSANLVPNPKDPGRKIKLKGCVQAEQLFEYLGEPVYKTGRTTGLTCGILDVAKTRPPAIQLSNGRIYFYENVIAVKNQGQKAFSQPGDSGSIVYANDGMALGLIIGGSSEYTFASPLSSCLKAVNAELLI